MFGGLAQLQKIVFSRGTSGKLKRSLKSLGIEDTQKLTVIPGRRGDSTAQPRHNPWEVGAVFKYILNAKPDNVDLDMTTEILEQTTEHALGTELTVEEVAAALRSMASPNAVGPDELPMGLLKPGLHHDHLILRKFHQVITRI